MAQEFWDEAQDMIICTEKHPFLVSMVDGSLSLDHFQYYVIQDALYLKDFADCLRRLSANVGVSVEDSRQLEGFATGAEEAEMCLHESFFQKWGIDATGAKPMPTTLLYTSHMLRVVTTRDHTEGLAILLPCFWLYMHVGKCMIRLRESYGDSVKRCPQFDEWIDMYGGDDFERQVTAYIKLVDEAAERATVEKRNVMKEHFLMSCRLEHMFWDQAQTMMQWPQIGEGHEMR